MQIIAEFHRLRTLNIEECENLLNRVCEKLEELSDTWEILFNQMLIESTLKEHTKEFEEAYKAFNSVDNIMGKLSEVKFKILKRVQEVRKLELSNNNQMETELK